MKVLRSGLLSSIRDMGRIGYGKYGIPESGAMDTYAARLANLLVGNAADAAVLEITLIGPALLFETGRRVAVCGLDAEVFIDDRKINMNEACQIEEGTVLDIRKITQGNFLYLAVSGGIQSEKILSSRSMYQGITESLRLQKGDVLPLLPLSDSKGFSRSASVRFDINRYKEKIFPVYPGPEWAMLSENEKSDLLSRKFTLSSDSNRMAFILNEKIKHNAPSILTGPVLQGTVQLTPAGQMIILMRDGQVTGGYPRILQLDAIWLDVLAQKRSGEQVKFREEVPSGFEPL